LTFLERKRSPVIIAPGASSGSAPSASSSLAIVGNPPIEPRRFVSDLAASHDLWCCSVAALHTAIGPLGAANAASRAFVAQTRCSLDMEAFAAHQNALTNSS
jgi:hypothetical protein